ncbi:MAG: cytochrome c biogenesis protein CcsA [Candidatus Limnocylindria bacterium]
MSGFGSLLVIGALASLLASGASGLGAILLGVAREPALASGAGSQGSVASHALRRTSSGLLVGALLLLVAALVIRAVTIGHAPWSNLHEFSLAFATAIVASHLVLGRAHPIGGLAPVTALLAAGIVAFALGLDDRVDPLVPALQQPLLLTVHVGAAALAYAVSGVAFVAAAGEIVQQRTGDRIPLLPSAADARALGHRAVLVAFPILTIAIVLGSVWANLAWRSYWSNDPKELAAAATWLVFGAYLHVAGRRDHWERWAPWLIVLGFAGVLFTYIGAGLFFIGEHSYAAP